MYIDCEYCGKDIYVSERFMNLGKEEEIECGVCLRKNKFILNIDRTSNIKPQEKIYVEIKLKEPLDDYNFMEIYLSDMKVLQKDREDNILKEVKIKKIRHSRKNKTRRKSIFY